MISAIEAQERAYKYKQSEFDSLLKKFEAIQLLAIESGHFSVYFSSSASYPTLMKLEAILKEKGYTTLGWQKMVTPNMYDIIVKWGE